MHQGGYIPPNQNQKRKRSFRGLPKNGNDKSIQHRGVNSMRMSYHIDPKCMKPMGGIPPENYEECMIAKIAKHLHIHRYMKIYIYIHKYRIMILGTGKNTALNPPSQKLVRSSVGPPDNRPGNSKCMKGTRFEICLFFCRATFWRLPEDLPNISPPHFIQKVGPKMYFFLGPVPQ